MFTTEQRAVFNTVFKIGTSLDRKFEATDLTPELRSAAFMYAASYDGDFDFMVGCRREADGGIMFFTDGRSKAILNCLMADARRRMSAKPKAPATTASSAPARVYLSTIPNGRYRVTLPDGDHLALRLSEASKDGKLAGHRILSTRINGDEWMGVAHITVPGGELRMWRSCAGDLRRRVLAAIDVLDDATREDGWLVAGLAFAQEGSTCFICGRDLDTPESLTAGYGPICADKLGLPWGAKAQPMSVILAQATAPAVVESEAPTAPEPEELVITPAARPAAHDDDDYAENRAVNAAMRAKKARGEKLTYADIFPEDI